LLQLNISQISNADNHQPILTKGTLAEVDKYLELMHQGQLAGRVVLKVA
jgi:hypothetical protein